MISLLIKKSHGKFLDILTFQMLKNNKKNNEKRSDKDPFILINLFT